MNVPQLVYLALQLIISSMGLCKLTRISSFHSSCAVVDYMFVCLFVS